MIYSSDPVSKVTHHVDYDAVADQMVLHTEQDISDTIELNRAVQNTYRRSSDRHGEWGEHVANIPPVVWEDLVRRGIAFDDKALLKWLDDKDNEAFRWHPTHLGNFSGAR